MLVVCSGFFFKLADRNKTEYVVKICRIRPQSHIRVFDVTYFSIVCASETCMHSVERPACTLFSVKWACIGIIFHSRHLQGIKVKVKEAYSSLQAGLPSPLREPTYYMGSHSVTCHPAEVTFPPLPQPKLVLDLATPEGGKVELT